MKIFIIALRNVNRQKKRSFLLGGAIAFGIMIVTLINGFAGSFMENVADNFSQLFAGHIFIEGVEKTEEGKSIALVRDETILLETVREEGIPVQYINKRSAFGGTVFFQGKSVQQQVVGISWDEEEFLKDRLHLVDGGFENMELKKGIILSQNVAAKLKVEINDTIDIRLRTVFGQLNVGDFVVAAISYDPGLFGSISAYANLEYVNELLTLAPWEYQTLGLFLDDIRLMDVEVQRLYQALGEKVELFERKETVEENPFMAMMRQGEEEEWEGIRYRLFTLNDFLKELEQIVITLNIASVVILLVLLVIIMVGITNTFRMIMYERIKEIGTMRALGMQQGGVKSIFLLEALFLSLGGAITGLFTAGIIMFGLSKIYWGLGTPLSLLMKNGYLTFSIQTGQALMYVIIVALFTLAAAYIPTRKAAKMKPVEALYNIGTFRR
ncbi:MAG: ABC transporter permease [Spirochaetales bacterium]|nr:ABC transporter permease [Spirochaetales bacterium]